MFTFTISVSKSYTDNLLAYIVSTQWYNLPINYLATYHFLGSQVFYWFPTLSKIHV